MTENKDNLEISENIDNTQEEPQVEESSLEETSEEEPEEEVKVYTPQPKKEDDGEVPAFISEKKEPEIGRRDIAPAVQYRKSMERERKIAQEVKKRQRRPMVLILAMCVVLIILAIIVNGVMKDAKPTFSETAKEPVTSQAPENSDENQPVLPPVTQVPQPVVVASAEPRLSSFEVYVEDISWEAARDKCAQMGGRLAVINDAEEYERVMEAIKGTNANKLWIGCYKYDGAIVWLDGEASSYYPWAQNEPSGYDSYDGAAEDYMMLWKYNDGWFYNDSRNDPVSVYLNNSPIIVVGL